MRNFRNTTIASAAALAITMGAIAVPSAEASDFDLFHKDPLASVKKLDRGLANKQSEDERKAAKQPTAEETAATNYAKNKGRLQELERTDRAEAENTDRAEGENKGSSQVVKAAGVVAGIAAIVGLGIAGFNWVKAHGGFQLPTFSSLPF